MKKLYALFFAIGAVCAAPYSVEEIHTSLEIVGVLMLVALVASLLVPFAAFSEKERINTFLLQNMPLIAFGVYAVEVVKYPTVVSAILLLASMSMHLSYWTAGLHSRKFRMDMFLTGVGQDRPDVVRRVTVLAALGRSQEADDIIRREMASWRSD
ncbi:TPA: hypothetical protein DDZ10_03715 [Candidatus Uhrbacteria bacterium]|nr:MAG: hypothetical protein A3D69_02450 [Candidatus Uhrbacteria bacterium RIFCSPHIGHO2_02_FULL_54_11]HBL39749.1 hypothetical protein [Candidatus Uhrbacteria bacterium]